MSPSNRSGFTLVELLVSVVILALGLLALAAGSGAVTRTIHGSRIGTAAAGQAIRQMDNLRSAARSTIPPCTSPNFATSVAATVLDGVTLSWRVAAAGSSRTVLVITSYPLGGGKTKVDTLSSTIQCT